MQLRIIPPPNSFYHNVSECVCGHCGNYVLLCQQFVPMNPLCTVIDTDQASMFSALSLTPQYLSPSSGLSYSIISDLFSCFCQIGQTRCTCILFNNQTRQRDAKDRKIKQWQIVLSQRCGSIFMCFHSDWPLAPWLNCLFHHVFSSPLGIELKWQIDQ